MTPFERRIAPLRHSPQLVEAVDILKNQVAEETKRRMQFYEEMTPEEKVEFIDGEIVMHSPAENRHLDTTSRLAGVLSIFVDVNQLGSVKTVKYLCGFPPQ